MPDKNIPERSTDEVYRVNDFDADILDSLKAHSGQNLKGGGSNLPPALQRLMAKSKIAGSKLRGE